MIKGEPAVKPSSSRVVMDRKKGRYIEMRLRREGEKKMGPRYITEKILRSRRSHWHFDVPLFTAAERRAGCVETSKYRRHRLQIFSSSRRYFDARSLEEPYCKEKKTERSGLFPMFFGSEKIAASA